MYEGWLTNWRDDFIDLSKDLQENFELLYSKNILNPSCNFQKTLSLLEVENDLEKFNIFSLISQEIYREFFVSLNTLIDSFEIEMKWSIHNFTLICFTDRIVQSYAFLDHFIKHSINMTLKNQTSLNLEKVVDDFYLKDKNDDFISLKRMMSVVTNPFDHFCPNKNFSNSSNFYAPDFAIEDDKFVKDSMKIHKFDIKGEVKYKTTDNYDTRVMSVFKTCYNTLSLVLVKMKKLTQ